MYYSQQDAERAAEYVIYLRKSRQDIEAEKRGEMETLARHQKILNEVAQEQGLNVVKVYKELVSGETIQDRPEMQQMMKEVYAGKYKGVLVVAADRLSRGDLENMGYILNGLKFSSTLLVTPGKTYDVAHNKYDEQMLEMQLFNSKQEYRAITGRMQEGKLLSVREGNWLASKPPFGYDISEPDKWTRTLNPNDKAEIVQDIFSMFVQDRLTCGQITKKLNSMHLPPPSGAGEWTRSTVRHILCNEAYIGKVRWQSRQLVKEMDENGKIERHKRTRQKYILVEGKHSALVDEEMFSVAQTLFAQCTRAKITNDLINPLAGLLRCSVCGASMVFKAERADGRGRARYTHREGSCKMKSTLADSVFDLLYETLRAHIADFSYKLDNADKMEMAKKHAAEMQRLEKELEKAKEKRRRLFDDYEDGNYTAEEFRERKAVWADRIERMTFEFEEMRKTKPAEIDYQEKIVSFSAVLDALKDDSVSAKDKNILLKDIIERIDYSCENDKYHGGTVSLDVVLKP